jgi:hypothetical protein
MKSVRIRTVRETEECPDLSHIGEYVGKLEPGVIDRRHRKFVEQIDYETDTPVCFIDWCEREGFKPYAYGEEPGTPTYYEYGLANYHRMEAYEASDWKMVGVYAVAEIVTDSGLRQEIRSGGLWGIESDSDESYFAQVEADEIAELWVELCQFGITEEMAA